MERLTLHITGLAHKYASALDAKITERIDTMRADDTSHYLIYRVLGINTDEGHKIDLYQNKGRFLYKYAGAFLEEATIACIKHRYPDAKRVIIRNNQGNIPRTFGIDCVVDNRAYEIKWRDATTDGDHIIKEHTRVKAIQSNGYIPIRLMFYYPNRAQAIRVQKTLETLYLGVGGEYIYGDSAWEHIYKETGIDLKQILMDIALAREV